MIYKNMDIWNAEEIIETESGFCWLRMPKYVQENMEHTGVSKNCTGVELRFVINSGEAKITMQAVGEKWMPHTFHVYYGSRQGGWEAHEMNTYVPYTPTEFTFKAPANLESLRNIAKNADDPFDPCVVRVIFDRGYYEILNVQGDIRPPKPKEVPQNKILFYGSSITHGSNSIDQSHSFASLLGNHFKTDVINKGMAGNCALEPEVTDFLMQQMKKDDICAVVLELGINRLEWEEDKIRVRAENLIGKAADAAPNKPVFVISPLYCYDDLNNNGALANKWRSILEQTVQKFACENLQYINGLELLESASLLSADIVHPNIYGIQQIYERLSAIFANSKKA